MCFAPQRCALFRHLNFQKWSEHVVFLTLWLRNVLRATTVCTFSTSQLPKLVRTWFVLYILTSKCASRHNGVHFFELLKMLRSWVLYILTWKCASEHNGVQLFISHLASWLRTRRFSEPTFRPSGATNYWKNTPFRDFPTFRAPGSSFFWGFLLLIFFLLLFSSLTLPISAFHLVHIVGSLTSKLRTLHINIWRVPKMGIPLNHPFLTGIFHEINHPAIKGYPQPLGNLPVVHVAWALGKIMGKSRGQRWGVIFLVYRAVRVGHTLIQKNL